MNIEKDIDIERLAIQQLLSDAQTQYDDPTYDPSEDVVSIPGDYKILFVLVRNYTSPTGLNYVVTPGSIKDKIFHEAVINFERFVNSITRKAVNLIIEKAYITENIVGTSENNVSYKVAKPAFLERLAPAGSYDSVIAVSGINSGGNTYACQFGGGNGEGFSNYYNYYGYSHCCIRTDLDSEKIDHGYEEIYDYPYLVTTNTFIHEWLHQLESYRTKLQVSCFPFTHAYYEDYKNPPEAVWQNRNRYQWQNYYSANTHPNVAEPALLNYYRAMLTAEVIYSPTQQFSTNRHKVGMYPILWKVTPRRLFVGRYLIQDVTSGNYYKSDGTLSNLANTTEFQWEIRTDPYSDSLRINAVLNYNTVFSISSTSNLRFVRIGPYDTGLYYFINETLNATLGYSLESTQTFSMVSIHSTDPHRMHISHYNDGFYQVRPELSTNLYLRTQNDSVAEGTKIGIYGFVLSHIPTSIWQFAYHANQSYSFYPLATTSKAAAFYSDYVRLTTKGGTNSQRWRLEKTNNGKFLFNGKYRIRNPSGKYIHTTDNSSLFLSNTATVWSIELDSTFGEDNFFRIYKMVGTTRKYFDVLNNHNSEGNTVQLHTLTSYVNAQTWKFMLLSDGQIWIVPKISINRGLKGTTTSMQISVTPTSWILEREGDL